MSNRGNGAGDARRWAVRDEVHRVNGRIANELDNPVATTSPAKERRQLHPIIGNT